MKININNLDLAEFDDEFIPVERIRKKSKDYKVKTKKELSDNNHESDNYKERTT